MNNHPLLNTDASEFPSWGAVRITLSVHAQHHWGRLGAPGWQWLMPISQQLVRYQPAHQRTTQSEALSKFNVRAAALNRQPLIQYP